MATRNDIEKPGVAHKDSDSDLNDSDDPILKEFTHEETRKIIHRIDRRLVTTVGLMYCISLMDRTNLSVAAIAGMNAELMLNINLRYNIVTLIFFTTYIVFEFPSTIVIRYLGPRNHLAGITFAWGLVMLGTYPTHLF